MAETEQTWRFSDLQRPFLYPLFLQVLCAALAGMFLDGGFFSDPCAAAIVGYWSMIGWMALRRRNALTKMDLILIRSGFLGWLAIVFLVFAAR